MKFKLIAKTNKAKEVLTKHGNLWKYINKSMLVTFSNEYGPWLLIYPVGGCMCKDSMWVHMSKDIDFKILEDK